LPFRRGIRLAITAVILMVVLAVTAFFALNLSGYCIQQGRYLSDEEMISVAVNRLYQSHLAEHKYNEQQGAGLPRLKDYKSVEHFLAENPNCCSFAETGRKGFLPYFYWSWFGSYRTFVKLTYVAEESDAGKEQAKTIYYLMSNCGRAGNGLD
jgi:hypothetical protein